MLKRTGQSKIRLHDSRHTTLNVMEKAGVLANLSIDVCDRLSESARVAVRRCCTAAHYC